MKRLASLSLLAGLLAGGCSEQRPAPELVILSVWSGVEVDQLHLHGASYDTTPMLTELSKELWQVRSQPGVASAETPELATLLTTSPPQAHGLLALQERGHARIGAEVETLAERAREAGWRTLASVSHAKFTLAGLERGFDTWRAPELEERERDAAQVISAIEAELTAELAAHERVLLVLHFGDLRGDTWRASKQTDSFFEQRIAPFRDQPGPVADAIAAKNEEQDLVTRLQRRLYRQGTGPARDALEASLYGFELERLDAALSSILKTVQEAGAQARVLVASSELLVGHPVGILAGSEVVLEREAAPQQVLRVVNHTALELGVKASVRDSGLELASEEVGGRAKASRTASLEGVGEVGYRLTTRGAELRLLLQGDACSMERTTIGGKPLDETDLCELHSRNSVDWPKEREEPPALELRALGGRREELEISGEGQVRLVLEYFPPNLELLARLAGQELEVAEHPYRADCAVITGKAPLQLELPRRVPSSRMGVALFIDGERVSGSRMKHREQVFSVPRRVELGLSPGAWIDPALRGVAPEDSQATVSLQLDDTMPPLPDYQLQARTVREFLQRTDD